MNSKITDIQGVLYLIKRHSLMMALLCGLSVAASCGKKASPNSTPKEDTRAKELLQGIWLNEAFLLGISSALVTLYAFYRHQESKHRVSITILLLVA